MTPIPLKYLTAANAIGRGVIVREGWEFDGHWVPWAATDSAPFVSFYDRLVASNKGLGARRVSAESEGSADG